VRPTTWRLLLGLAAIGFVLTWAVLTVGESRTGTIPDVPWPSAAVLGVFGGAVLVVTLALRPRLRGRQGHDPVNPIVAARFAVLALACSRAGALFVGVYAAFLALALTDLTIPYRRHLALAAGACVLAALVVLVAGLVLERLLRLPEPPPGSSRPGGPAGQD
jgi:Protein of unknown function (DUF3180)